MWARAPAPTTVCQGGGEAVVVTVNPNSSAVTQTNLVYETSILSGTVVVGYVPFLLRPASLFHLFCSWWCAAGAAGGMGLGCLAAYAGMQPQGPPTCASRPPQAMLDPVGPEPRLRGSPFPPRSTSVPLPSHLPPPPQHASP